MRSTPKGFTLIEIMVSVAIFAIVMTIALGALLAMSESDRKAQSLKSVINNLNFALDSMSRAIRTGDAYHCDINTGVLTEPRDCVTTAGSSISFLDALGQQITYKLETVDGTVCGQRTGSVGCIVRRVGSGSFMALTSPEVKVTTLKFYVLGSLEPIDEQVALGGVIYQPKVTLLVSGTVSTGVNKNSTFNLQTSVTQRLYDN